MPCTCAAQSVLGTLLFFSFLFFAFYYIFDYVPVVLRRYHNYLRITRILKSLGELGYEHYKVHFVETMLREALSDKQRLLHCAKSCVEYWIHTLRDEEERQRLKTEAEQLIQAALDDLPQENEEIYSFV